MTEDGLDSQNELDGPDGPAAQDGKNGTDGPNTKHVREGLKKTGCIWPPQFCFLLTLHKINAKNYP